MAPKKNSKEFIFDSDESEQDEKPQVKVGLPTTALPHFSTRTDPVSSDSPPQKAKTEVSKNQKPSAKAAAVKSDSDPEGYSPSSGCGLAKNDEGDEFLSLSSNRRVTVRKFKGSTLIDIREVSPRRA